MVGAQNMLDTYPQVSARSASVGEKYSEYTPWDSTVRISTRESPTLGAVDAAVSQFIMSRDGPDQKSLLSARGTGR